MAIALEAHFTKSDLMNAYINEIYLGQDGDRAVHGFGLASQFYFGKPLTELDLAQLSLLVALVRGPSYYDPRHHPERALARRNLVLKLMADLKVISPEDAASAARAPLGVTTRAAGAYYPSYLDFVRRTLRRDYPDTDLTQEGLKIYTSLEPRAQDEAEQTLDRELARLERGRAHQRIPRWRGGHHRACKRRCDRDRRRPAHRLQRLQSRARRRAPHGLSGETVRLSDGARDPSLQSRASCRMRRSTSACRTARTGAHSISRARPTAPVPLVRALAESMNLATVAVGMDVGVTHVAQTLQRFGLERAPAQVPALLLGAVNATPLEVAQLYTGLANGGYRMPLRAVRTGDQRRRSAAQGVSAGAHADCAARRRLRGRSDDAAGDRARHRTPRRARAAGRRRRRGQVRNHRRTCATAGSRDSPAAISPLCGWATTTIVRRASQGAAAALAIWSRVLADRDTLPGARHARIADRCLHRLLDRACRSRAPAPIRIPSTSACLVSTQLPKKPGCIAALVPSAWNV
jgi:membrane carboxypeptidase/penicillin-binding protein